MKNLKWILGVAFTLLILGAGLTSHAAITDPLTTIELDKPVHFLAPDGSDVRMDAGTYTIEPAEEWIRLMTGERHDAILIEAKKGSHELEIEHTTAISIPGKSEGQEDHHYVMLLLPGGQSLDATGTYSGIRGRGFFKKAFNNAKNSANRAYKKARSTAKKTVSKAKSTARKATKQVKKQTQKAVSKAKKGVQNIRKGAQNVRKSAQRAAKKAGSAVKKGYRSARDAALHAKRSVEKAARKAVDAVRTAGVNIANLLARGHFVGPADTRQCRRMGGNQGLGNNTAVGRGKFRNFRIGSAFQDMNNYLLMQASIKTYYKQFNFRPRTDPLERQPDKIDSPRNEAEYRCAATELYRNWGFTQVYFVNSPQSANAIVASNNNMAIIAIRGTEGKGAPVNAVFDIVTTVANTTVPFVLPTKKGLKVGNMHVGYAAMTSTFVPLLEHAMQQMRLSRTTPIYVTGHSLGASTATLAAFALKILNYKVDAAYVYAPPKVGDLLLNKSIKRTLALYVTDNYRDPVPGIPYLSNVRINPFFPAMDAARKSIYFNRQHQAVEFGANVKTVTRERQILGDQGMPPPMLFARGGEFLSNEWKFHNGNFYTAFAYEKVRRTRPVNGTNIEPEYSLRDNMCINGQDTHHKGGKYQTPITHVLLMSDRHSNPMQACKGLTKKLKDAVKNMKQKRRSRR